MMTAEQLQQKLLNALDGAGLSKFLVRDRVQVLNLAGDFFIDIVVSDASQEHVVLEKTLFTLNSEKLEDTSLSVRSLWEIYKIGDPAPAYGTNGSIRAAVLIPVTLRSGQEKLEITVAVTKLAEMEFDRILGRKTPMKDVASLVVSNALQRGGQSSWNPRVDDYLEVGSSVAPQISRLLKKTA